MDYTISSFPELIQLYRAVMPEQAPHRANLAMAVHNAFPHVEWMLLNMPSYRDEGEKYMRCLGFIQGILWENNIYTLDQLREQTRLASLGKQE